MKFPYSIYILIFVYKITNLSAQQNPIWPLGIDTNQINCTFSEKHGNHIHSAIDINAHDGARFKAVLDGIVLNNASTSDFFTMGHDFQNDDYNSNLKQIRYGDSTDNLNNILLHKSVIHGNYLGITLDGSHNHLHFEMWIRDGAGADFPWRRVDPLNNPETNYQLDIPGENDVTHPQINDIILQSVNQPQGIASGCYIINNSGGIYTNLSNCLRFHIHDRQGSESDNEYNLQNDKVFVYGSLASILHERDFKVTTGIQASGTGLGIYEAIFRINNVEKYKIKFDEILSNQVDSYGSFYHTSFNSSSYDQLYGNNDYLEMRRIDAGEQACLPHKLINGIQSNGIWATRARIGTNQIFSTTPTTLARSNSEALYPDGKHLLSYTVSDAAGNHSDASVSVIVDNFAPYVESVEMEVGNEVCYKKSWEWQSCGGIKFTNEVDTTYEKETLETAGMFITITASEPLSEMKLSIPFYNLSNLVGTAVDTTNRKFEFWTYPVTSFNLAASKDLIITGKDYRGNNLMDLKDFIYDPCLSPLPYRTGQVTWFNPKAIPLNLNPNNGDRTHKLPCTTIHFNPFIAYTQPTACDTLNGALCHKSGYATGGFPVYHYHWENDEGDTLINTFCGPSNLGPGKYWYIAVDSVGCDIRLPYNLISPHYPVVLESVDHTCPVINIGRIEVGAYDLSLEAGIGTGTFNFHWSNGHNDYHVESSVISNLAVGNYCVTITSDIGNCNLIKCYEIGNKIGAPPIIGDVSYTNPCPNQSNGKIIVSATGTLEPILYNWGNGYGYSRQSDHLADGNYCVTVKDYCNHYIDTCVLLQSVSGFITKDPGCEQGSLTAHAIHGNPPYTYKWDYNYATNTNPTFTPFYTGFKTVNIKDSKGCNITIGDTLFNTSMDTFNLIRSCERFNDGSFSVKVYNPFKKAGTLTVSRLNKYFAVFNIPSGLAEYDINVGDLYGDYDLDYNLKLEIDSCLIESYFRFKPASLEDTFVKVIRDTCFYYQYCKGVKVTPPGGFYKEPVIYNASTTTSGLFSCIEKGFCNGREVGQKKAPFKSWRVAKFLDLVNKLYGTYYESFIHLDALIARLNGHDPCDFVTFCPLNLDIIDTHADVIGGITAIFEGGGGTGEIVPLGNGCHEVQCPGIFNDFIYCGWDVYGDIFPNLELDTLFNNCNPTQYNVYQLIKWQTDLQLLYGNKFVPSELDSFLTFHHFDKAAKCAEVRFCRSDFSILYTDINLVSCDSFPEPAKNIDFPLCTPVVTGTGDYETVYCRCEPEDEEPGHFCYRHLCIANNFNKGFLRSDDENPNFIVTHINETRDNQEFIDFGYSRWNSVITPKPIFRTENNYQLYDYTYSGKTVSYRNLPTTLKSVFFELDSFKIISLLEKTPNRIFELQQDIDTLIYLLNMSSNVFLSIEKVFRNSSSSKIIGKFSGILKFNDIEMSSYKTSSIFYAEIDDSGNLIQFHLIDNSRTERSIYISNENNKIEIDGYANDGSITLNGISNALITSDNSFHLVIDDQGLSFNSNEFIKDTSVILVKSIYNSLKEIRVILFRGNGNLSIGDGKYNLSGHNGLLLCLNESNQKIWQREIPLEALIDGKYDFTFNENGDVVFGLTSNRSYSIDGVNIDNCGQDDIHFFRFNSDGYLTGSKSFCSTGNENIKKMFFDNGVIYFGGEFKSDSSFVFIGHNEYYNAPIELQHAYTSFIIDADFSPGGIFARNTGSESVNSKISIYPNPTKNSINLKINLSEKSKVEYYIFDINGVQQDYRNYNDQFNNNIEINNFNALEPGVYIIKIYINGIVEKIDKIIKM